MDLEKRREKYLRRVKFLRENIPLDDIYEFTEQALSCADFFLFMWSRYTDVIEECENDAVTHSYVFNLLGLRSLEEKGYNQGISICDFIEDSD